jgi:hypothetical protein
MRTVVAAAVVAAVLAVPAQAKAPGYQRQINALTAQVRTLRTQLAALQTGAKDSTSYAAVTRDWATCFHASDLDEINSVWHVLNLDLKYQGLPTQPDFPRYDDQGACARIGVTR